MFLFLFSFNFFKFENMDIDHRIQLAIAFILGLFGAVIFPPTFGLELYGGEGCVEPPLVCPNKNITFHLYSKANNYQEYILDVNNIRTIINAPLLPNARLKFLLHIFAGSKDGSPNKELRPAFIRRPVPVNLISVNYEPLVREGCYTQAVNNAPLVAKCTAQFLDLLFKLRPDISIKQLHVIGISLGAQIGGQLRNYLKCGVIPRITGLDPALPGFPEGHTPPEKYLNRGDASVVDIVLTNSGENGIVSPKGDINFYANDGTHQPQCGDDGVCSHVASAVYYAESINSAAGFWGKKCYNRDWSTCCDCKKSKWNVFGEYTKLNIHGSFYFKTNNQPPYAKGIVKKK